MFELGHCPPCPARGPEAGGLSQGFLLRLGARFATERQRGGKHHRGRARGPESCIHPVHRSDDRFTRDNRSLTRGLMPGFGRLLLFYNMPVCRETPVLEIVVFAGLNVKPGEKRPVPGLAVLGDGPSLREGTSRAAARAARSAERARPQPRTPRAEPGPARKAPGGRGGRRGGRGDPRPWEAARQPDSGRKEGRDNTDG